MGVFPNIDYLGRCHCSGNGFQTIQSRRGSINHKKFRLEQGKNFAILTVQYRVQKFFPDENWFDWVLRKVNFSLIHRPCPLFKIHLLTGAVSLFFSPGARRQKDQFITGYQNQAISSLEQSQICEGPAVHPQPCKILMSGTSTPLQLYPQGQVVQISSIMKMFLAFLLDSTSELFS